MTQEFVKRFAQGGQYLTDQKHFLCLPVGGGGGGRCEQLEITETLPTCYLFTKLVARSVHRSTKSEPF